MTLFLILGAFSIGWLACSLFAGAKINYLERKVAWLEEKKDEA